MIALVLAASAGTPERVPIDVEAHALALAWSADGEKLAVQVGDMDRHSGLWAGPPGELVRVTMPGSSPFATHPHYAHPVWHCEGSLVFEGRHEGSASRLYFVVMSAGYELLSVDRVQGDLAYPTIGPGGRLAFVGGEQADVMAYGTSEPPQAPVTPLTHTAAQEAWPAWDVGDARVAFARGKGDLDIWVREADGKEVEVAVRPGVQTRPAFDAAGRVVYLQQRDAAWDLLVEDGSGPKVLASDVRLPTARLALTPERDAVIVAPGRGEVSVLRVVPTDGGPVRELRTGLVAVGDPAVVGGARPRVAFTALPEATATWRAAWIMDL
ncbi:MAG: hypothetical protein KC656_03265 [Myxococcales bacterium]|nr:hypothetical protein [Myxococcales bacterium]MCB9669619.1 hypothetical protein [Alphaproteobacteria bacterium]